MLLAFAATAQLYGESLMQKHRKYSSGSTEIDDVVTLRSRLQVQTGLRTWFHETNDQPSKWIPPKGVSTPFLPSTASLAILSNSSGPHDLSISQCSPLKWQKIILNFAVLIFCSFITEPTHPGAR